MLANGHRGQAFGVAAGVRCGDGTTVMRFANPATFAMLGLRLQYLLTGPREDVMLARLRCLLR